MKKFTAFVLSLVLVLGVVACTPTKNSTKTYKIGICNYVDDASLNQIVSNIRSQLDKIATEQNVKFEIKYDNCNADSSVMNQIIANFIAEKVDLMVAVATPVAMAMQAATEDNKIPVVFAAVSDPMSTHLVSSLEKPGANVTGTSDFLNTEAILDVMLSVNPTIKKVGLLYDVGQDASTTPIATAKTFLSSKGITVVERTGTNVSEISLAADALITEGVEAVFTPTDNTVMTAELSIYEKFANAKIPQYCGADSFALNGAFCGYGVDYANLGVETANMVADILIKGSKPETTAVKTFDNGTATINTEICEKLGFDYETIKTTIAPYCIKVQPITTAENFED
jgi:putative ABC transport system substrate-binding protein